MKTIQRYATLAGIVAILAMWGCGDALTDSEPRPGFLTVSLTTSHPDDGAVSLVLRGTGIASPAATNDSNQLFSIAGEADGELRLAVIGESLSGSLIRFAVPDVHQIASYTAELVEVADQSNELRENLEGYRLVISDDGS